MLCFIYILLNRKPFYFSEQLDQRKVDTKTVQNISALKLTFLGKRLKVIDKIKSYIVLNTKPRVSQTVFNVYSFVNGVKFVLQECQVRRETKSPHR